jgi:small subunit ribosomal protein S6
VFLVHPDQSEQVPAMMSRYRAMIEGTGGTIHREEDWGRRQLAHSIQKVHKAHYLMLNIECGKDALEELIGAFRFSDAVLRHLVIKRDKAITEPSVMAQAHEEEKAREAQASTRDSRPRDSGSDNERGASSSRDTADKSEEKSDDKSAAEEDKPAADKDKSAADKDKSADDDSGADGDDSSAETETEEAKA